MTRPYDPNKKYAPEQDVPDVDVVIGNVSITDQQAQYINDNKFESIITDYQVRHDYELDGHVYMLPVTSPVPFRQAAAAFVQLAHPTLLWLVRWTAARWKEPPEAPDPDLAQGSSQEGRWVLLDVHMGTANLVVSPNGVTPLYRLSGTYVYGCINPDNEARKILDKLLWPRRPDIEDAFNRDGSQVKFRRGIIGR